MQPRKILCLIGLHNYRTVELTDCFYTTYSDMNWGPIKHMVYYLECKCCGKRGFKSTYKKDIIGSGHHSGIEYAKAGWIEHGVIYLGEGKAYKPGKPPAPKGAKLKVVDGGKK